jgi:hypothetical protein
LAQDIKDMVLRWVCNGRIEHINAFVIFDCQSINSVVMWWAKQLTVMLWQPHLAAG